MVSITIQLQDPHLLLPIDSALLPHSTPSSFTSSASSSFLSPIDTSSLSSSPSSTSSISSISLDQHIPSSPSITPYSSHSNLHIHTPQPPGTTPLKGTLTLTLSKPIKVVSLAVTLDGSSHLSLTTRTPYSPAPVNTDKRIARYTRQHIRAQQFLIEPTPNPDHYITLVAVNTSTHATHSVDLTSGPAPSSPSLMPNQIAYPFEINVPNHMPVSVSTPHGGTSYRLTAELTIPKSSLGIMALLSPGSGSSSSQTSIKSVVTTVLVYRAGFPPRPLSHGTPPSPHATGSVDVAARLLARLNHGDTDHSRCDVNGCGSDSCLSSDRLKNLNQVQSQEDRAQSSISSLSSAASLSYSQHSCHTGQPHGCMDAAILHPEQPIEADAGSETDIDRDENTLVSDSISYTWPGQIEASIMTPFVHLPPKSKLDLHVRIKCTSNSRMIIKYLQVSLWERAIYRVGKTYKPQQAGHPNRKFMAVVGIRDRSVSTQRMESCWPKDVAGTANTLIQKVIRFTTPNPIREPNELYSSRNCNPSTYSQISKQERQELTEDLEDPSVDQSAIELGEIDIEIQHFLKCSLMLMGTKSESIEKDIGDIPVVIRGVPGGPECDRTGLPTYLGSFATSSPSLEERQSYEETTRSRMNSIASDDFAWELFAKLGHSTRTNDHGRNSVFSLASITESDMMPEDYENDDAYLAVMGMRGGAMTPPRYEDSLRQHPLDAAINIPQVNSLATTAEVTHAVDLDKVNLECIVTED